MNILVLSTEDNFGAGKATYRIQQSLNKNGQHNSLLLVKKKTLNTPNVIAYDEIVHPSLVEKIFFYLNRIFNSHQIQTDSRFYFFGNRTFEYNFSPKKVLKSIKFNPDVIVITWISGFLTFNDIKKLQKLSGAYVIFYPLDMSLFTGGCHYVNDCNGYLKNCFNCPAILTKSKKFLSHKIWLTKFKSLCKIKFSVFAASSQLLTEISESSLFRHSLKHKVHLPVNENIFNTVNRITAGEELNLGPMKKVIFFGATFSTEERKGYKLFVEALKQLSLIVDKDLCSEIIILMAGNSPKSISSESNIAFDVKYLGYVNSDIELANIYKASSVFVVTSIQDSGPMMVNESLMCGTPVVMFDVGIAKDLISNNQNGAIVSLGDTNELAYAIRYFLTNKIDYKNIGEMAKVLTSYDYFANRFISCLKSSND